MEVFAITSPAPRAATKLLEQQHELRARIFSDRLGWDVSVQGGQELDEFDHLRPTYILAVSETGRVAGCARLLPTTGPTMLQNTFPMLLSERSLPSSESVVESSRFCVDTALAEGRGGGLHLATLTMFAGIIEWSMANGYREIVTATDIRFERILNRSGWRMERLGAPQRVGNTVAVAGKLPADPPSFERVCPPGYRRGAIKCSTFSFRRAA